MGAVADKMASERRCKVAATVQTVRSECTCERRHAVLWPQYPWYHFTNFIFLYRVKIGRATCRERGWQYVYSSGLAGGLSTTYKRLVDVCVLLRALGSAPLLLLLFVCTVNTRFA